MTGGAGKTVIGVTGGLATGKTTVTDMLVSLGARRIDADGISHDLLDNDENIRNRLISLFGREMIDKGRIDRKRLRREVFFDRENLEALCGLMHPAITDRIGKMVQKMDAHVIALDAPLLIEASLQDMVDVVVLVKSGLGIQVARAIDRGISEEEARAIIGCQMPLERKERYADYVIENDMDMDTLKEGVTRIWQKIQKGLRKNWT